MRLGRGVDEEQRNKGDNDAEVCSDIVDARPKISQEIEPLAEMASATVPASPIAGRSMGTIAHTSPNFDPCL